MAQRNAGANSVDLTRQLENGRIVYDARFLHKGILIQLKITEAGVILQRNEIRNIGTGGEPIYKFAREEVIFKKDFPHG